MATRSRLGAVGTGRIPRIAYPRTPTHLTRAVPIAFGSGTAGGMTPEASRTAVGPEAGDAPTGHLINLSETTVLKAGNVYAVTERDGTLAVGIEHPLGIYRDDCRFVSGHRWTVNGVRPLLLVTSAGLGSEAVHELTNPPLRLADGRVLGLQSLQLRFERRLGDADHVEECLEVRSYDREPVELDLRLELATDFKPMLAIRGIVDPRDDPPSVAPVAGGLRFSARGRDDYHRALTVTADPAPDEVSGASLVFRLRLEPGEERRVQLALAMHEAPEPPGEPSAWQPSHTSVEALEGWLRAHPQVETDDELY